MGSEMCIRDSIRVPPKQGTNFHRLLKAKGVETRLVRNGMYRSEMARTKSEKKTNQSMTFGIQVATSCSDTLLHISNEKCVTPGE